MPHTSGERRNRSHLEMEVNTTKDTIWRLTNRVCALECEFKRFKNLLKRSVLKPSALPTTSKKSAKAAEIARRKKQQENRIENNDVVVKKEVESPAESSDNEMPMDECSSDFNEDFHELSSLENVNNDNDYDNEGCDPDSDSGGSDEDYEAQIRIKSPRELFGKKGKIGRRKSDIWANFKRMDVVAEDGQKTTITICKLCKRSVSSRGYRLQKHLAKCVISPKDPFGMGGNLNVENTKAMETGVNTDDLETASAEENDFNYEAIAAEAVSLSPAKSGRKRTPIWTHFIRKPKPETPDRPTRKYSVIAICKNCKAEVSAKAGRMTIHLQKCLSGQVNAKPLGTLKKHNTVNTTCFATPKHELLSGVVSQSAANKTESSMETNSPSMEIPTTSVIIDGASEETASTLNSCDSKATMNPGGSAVESKLLASVGSSVVGRRASAVWQYYNITKELKDGRIFIASAVCKSCSKFVSPKPGRLSLHLKKCKPQH